MSELTVLWACPRCKQTVPLQAYTDDENRDENEGIKRQIVHCESDACKAAVKK